MGGFRAYLLDYYPIDGNNEYVRLYTVHNMGRLMQVMVVVSFATLGKT